MRLPTRGHPAPGVTEGRWGSSRDRPGTGGIGVRVTLPPRGALAVTPAISPPASAPAPPVGVVVLAASAGGLAALSKVLANLPGDFPAPLVVVQHLDPSHRSLMASILGRRVSLPVKQVEEGDLLTPGRIYIAPPDRHVLVNPDGTLALTRSEQVHYVRPSADVLFASAAAVFAERAVAV